MFLSNKLSLTNVACKQQSQLYASICDQQAASTNSRWWINFIPYWKIELHFGIRISFVWVDILATSIQNAENTVCFTRVATDNNALVHQKFKQVACSARNTLGLIDFQNLKNLHISNCVKSVAMMVNQKRTKDSCRNQN